MVRSVHIGRESLFELEPQPIEEKRDYLDQVSKQWDDALTPRLDLPSILEEKFTPQR
jgi:hypothetical protein